MSKEKLDLKKIRISKLDSLHFINGGSNGTPSRVVKNESLPPICNQHTIPQSRGCERDPDNKLISPTNP